MNKAVEDLLARKTVDSDWSSDEVVALEVEVQVLLHRAGLTQSEARTLVAALGSANWTRGWAAKT